MTSRLLAVECKQLAEFYTETRGERRRDVLSRVLTYANFQGLIKGRP